MPSPVLAAARRAISLRKRCANWFKQALGGQSKDDHGHWYFIQVLERVLDILGAPPPDEPTTAAASSATPGSDKPSFADIQNRFASLVVEDGDQDDVDDNADIGAGKADSGNRGKKKGKSGKPAAKPNKTAAEPSLDPPYEPDETSSGEGLDMFLELYCLFEDLRSMRSFLHSTWSDYAAGTLDLMSASVTTNTAFDLVRQETEEFLAKNPKMDGLAGAPTFMLLLACEIKGIDPAAARMAGDPFPFELMETWEWCLLPTCQLLDAFTRVLHP